MGVYAVFLRNPDSDRGSEFLQAHIDYLTGLRERGIVLANGRLLDGWGGVVLYRGDSADDVRALVGQDPFVLHGIRAYELFEWDVRWSPAVDIRPASHSAT